MKKYILIAESKPGVFEEQVNRASANGYEIHSFHVDASAASRYTALMFKHTFDRMAPEIGTTAKPWGVM